MRIRPIQLETSNRFIENYRLEKNDVMEYFSYRPFESLEKRVLDLRNRTFQRQALSEILNEMNTDWDAPEETLLQIDRLKDEGSVVVIGGQRAGLFTGPLCTIKKIILVVTFAKRQEKKLNIPVIPVFWIAGEDHDYDEINHIYTMRKGKLHKHAARQSLHLKQSISQVPIDKEKTAAWMEQALLDVIETEHTKEIYAVLENCLQQSHTYVDFFARMIYALFPDEGIVLIDSAHPSVRALESKWFIQMIEKQPAISKAV